MDKATFTGKIIQAKFVTNITKTKEAFITWQWCSCHPPNTSNDCWEISLPTLCSTTIQQSPSDNGDITSSHTAEDLGGLMTGALDESNDSNNDTFGENVALHQQPIFWIFMFLNLPKSRALVPLVKENNYIRHKCWCPKGGGNGEVQLYFKGIACVFCFHISYNPLFPIWR